MSGHMSSLMVAIGYKDSDGNPDWLNAMLIAGFVVAALFAIAGYLYYRSKGARDR
jgi:NADH:ubiquinone oxidoreductase subunit 4 (subunit M)